MRSQISDLRSQIIDDFAISKFLQTRKPMMTPFECCRIGATCGATGSRDLTALQTAARAHHVPFEIEVLEKELRRHPEAVDGWVRWVKTSDGLPARYLTK
ncbi:MAG: hypothetical protein U0996_22390 [Planctomycetaceae bacterium]